MGLIVFTKHWKFNVHSQYALETHKKMFGFVDNDTRLGNDQLSLLQ